MSLYLACVPHRSMLAQAMEDTVKVTKIKNVISDSCLALPLAAKSQVVINWT